MVLTYKVCTILLDLLRVRSMVHESRPGEKNIRSTFRGLKNRFAPKFEGMDLKDHDKRTVLVNRISTYPTYTECMVALAILGCSS